MNSKFKYFEIPIDKEIVRFESHLQELDNNRIILSGRFGTGKTCFIKEFFDRKKDKYNLFYLCPINYQISTNEDIIELIKFDILLELIAKGWINDKQNNVYQSLILQFFLIDNADDIVLNFLKMIPKVGKAASLIKSIIPLIKKYQKQVSEFKKSNYNIVSEFLNEIENVKGSPYEIDTITQLIYSTIEENKQDGIQNVLIIDDIDRIDPEHIFRMFNIFSSHFDLESEIENKFSFDKVIFICDIENIRNIFHAKYGQDVDFSGYIDKFYSNRVYQFSLEEDIAPKIGTIFKPSVNKQLDNYQKDVAHTIKCFLLDFIRVKAINLRDLQHVYKSNFFENNYTIIVNNRNRLEHFRFQLIHALLILKFFLGNDNQKLIYCFNKCQNKLNETKFIFKNWDIIIPSLPFLDIEKFDIDCRKHIITIDELNTSIEFTLFKVPVSENIEFRYAANDYKITYNQSESSTVEIYLFYNIIERIYSNIINLRIR